MRKNFLPLWYFFSVLCRIGAETRNRRVRFVKIRTRFGVANFFGCGRNFGWHSDILGENYLSGFQEKTSENPT